MPGTLPNQCASRCGQRTQHHRFPFARAVATVSDNGFALDKLHEAAAPLVAKGMNFNSTSLKETLMTLCPIAIAVGCKKCALFNVCPAKGIIGDYKKEEAAPAPEKKDGE